MTEGYDTQSRRPRVVIVGAGFGGLATARQLADAPVDVTLVDRHNYHTFQPLLYQVATAGLNAADVAYAVRGIFQDQSNLTFRQATVTGVDWDGGVVLTDSGDLAFDFVVIGAGAQANYFGVEGVAEHAFPLYSLTDAVELRNHVLACFETADAQPDRVHDGILTFVIVGGGPTGVETAGALSELFTHVLARDFKRVDVAKARVVLVEMTPVVLGAFSKPSQRHALDTLAAHGVEARLEEAVAVVEPTRVRLQSGEEIRTHTVIWAAGVQANELAQKLGVATTKGGRILTGPDLALPEHPEAFAIGDVAVIDDRKHGPLPQLAPVAMQSGRHAARQIIRRLEGQPPSPFRYRDRGTMATVGRRAAVAELPLRIRLRGTLAWLAWLGLHLVFLMGMRNRLSVLLNWAWNYLTWDRGPRIILRPDPPR